MNKTIKIFILFCLFSFVKIEAQVPYDDIKKKEISCTALDSITTYKLLYLPFTKASTWTKVGLNYPIYIFDKDNFSKIEMAHTLINQQDSIINSKNYIINTQKKQLILNDTLKTKYENKIDLYKNSYEDLKIKNDELSILYDKMNKISIEEAKTRRRKNFFRQLTIGGVCTSFGIVTGFLLFK